MLLLRSLPNSAAAAGASAATGSRLATASHCVAGRATSGVRDPSTASLPDGFSSNSRMGTVAWDCKQLQQQPQETTRLDGVAFQLHSRLEAVSTYSQSSLLREQAWCTRSELLQQGSGAAQHQQVSASEVEPCHGSVQWFEGKLQEVGVCPSTCTHGAQVPHGKVHNFALLFEQVLLEMMRGVAFVMIRCTS